MSVQAERERRHNRRWATAGSGHDRVIRLLRFGLPVVIGVIAGVLVFSPFTQRAEVSFLLSKDSVEVARERMRVTKATYRGQDAKGQPFALVAGSAVQKSSDEPVVRMTDLSGAITLADGPATIAASAGAYDMKTERVTVPGALSIATGDGYRLLARGVAIDLKARELRGTGGVDGSLNLGRFSANQLFVDMDARIVRLSGNARLRINQGVL